MIIQLSTITGITLNEALSDLEKCELQSDLLSQNSQDRRFVFFDGKSCVSFCNYLARIKKPELRTRVSLQKYNSNIVKNLFTYVPIGKTNVRASHARLINNFTAFYPEQELVCKIYYTNRGEVNAQREAKAIKTAESLNLFRVPSIILDQSETSPINQPVVWFEKVKFSNDTGNPADIAVKFLKVLLAWYEVHSIEFSPVTKLASKLSKFNFTQEKLVSQGWHKNEAKLILTLIDKLLKSRWVIPSSWIHGDANLENCKFNQEGEIVIFDWESSRWDYVIKDVHKLVEAGGMPTKNLYTKWLEKQSQSCSDIMPVDAQLSLMKIFKGPKRGIPGKGGPRLLLLKDVEKYFANQKISKEESRQVLSDWKKEALTAIENVMQYL